MSNPDPPVKRRAWLTPVLIAAVVALAAIVFAALWLVTGIETTLTVEDKQALVTMGKLEAVFPEHVVVDGREVVDKTQLRGLVCELHYTYDDTEDSGVLVDHLIMKELDDSEAESTLFWLREGLSAMGREDYTEEAVDTDLRWGDEGRVTLVKRGEEGIAWRFLARKGPWVHQLILSGRDVTNAHFVEVVDAALVRFDRAPPCRD